MRKLLTWYLWIVSTCVACGDHDSTSADVRALDDAGPAPSADAELRDSGQPRWSPLNPSDTVEGRSMREWAEEWVRWTNAATSCEEAFADPDGAFCDRFQMPDSPVFFMQMGVNGTMRTKCVVPSAKYIFVPIAGIYDDDAAWMGPPRTAEKLEEDVAKMLASLRDVTLRVDGSEFDRSAADWSIGGPHPTRYDLPPKPNVYSCNGTDVGDRLIEPVYFGGAFAMLPPAEPGQHELEYGGTITNPFGAPQRWHVNTVFEVRVP